MPREVEDPAPNRTLHRALDVLECVARAGRPLGLTELARDVSGSKATAYRLLATLETRGYVSQDARTRAYSTGIRCFELGSLWAQSLDLRFVASPFLDRLNAETLEIIHLAVYDHGDAVYIDKRDSLRPVAPSSHVGRRAAAFCVATGRALLAHQPQDVLAAVLSQPLPRYTPKTITDPVELAQLLAQARADGYAVNHESLREDVSGIAAPVRDHTGAVIATVGCCLPEQRFGADRLPMLRDRTVAAAQDVTAALGGHMRDVLDRRLTSEAALTAPGRVGEGGDRR